MSYDGVPLTFRQAAGFVLMRLSIAAYCLAWVCGFVWLVSS